MLDFKRINSYLNTFGDLKYQIKVCTFGTMDFGTNMEDINSLLNNISDALDKYHDMMTTEQKNEIIKGLHLLYGTDLTSDVLSVKASLSYFMDAFNIPKMKMWHIVSKVYDLKNNPLTNDKGDKIIAHVCHQTR